MTYPKFPKNANTYEVQMLRYYWQYRDFDKYDALVAKVHNNYCKTVTYNAVRDKPE